MQINNSLAQNADTQAVVTPDLALELLMDGNKRFVDQELFQRDYKIQIDATAGGQWPFAVLLGCIDSRVPMETIFDQGVGDIFSARLAGNVVNEDVLGSMEYACKVAGSKLVMVLGHSQCGAVKSACDGVELGNITPLLAKIKPAVEQTETKGERNSENKAFVQDVIRNNVFGMLSEIRKHSTILNEMEAQGEIKLCGAVYDVATGKVQVLEES